MESIDYSLALPPHKLQALVRSWLEEDVPSVDYAGIVVGDGPAVGKLFVKSPCILCGAPFFDAIFRALDCKVTWIEKEGAEFPTPHQKKQIATVEGPCRKLLLGERVALNCLARCSGIATTCRKLLTKIAVKGWKGRIAATRKTTPGFRLVEKYAVMVGGADTHRFDLSSMCMLKDNHVHGRSITQAVEKVKSASGFSLKLEVECKTLEEAMEAAQAGADIVMFDNFCGKDLGYVAKCVKEKFPAVIVEASGGVNEDNLLDFCVPHVDVISTSTLVQGYDTADFSLKTEMS